MDVSESLKPGDSVHYTSLLDENGNTLTTLALVEPITIPIGHEVGNLRISTTVHIEFTLKGHAE